MLKKYLKQRCKINWRNGNLKLKLKIKNFMNWLIFFSSVLWKCSLVSWFDSCSRYYHESSWSPCRNWFWCHPEVAVPLRCWVDKNKFIVNDWIFQHDIMRQNPGSVILDDEITSTLIISFTYYLCIKETSAIVILYL